MTSSTLEFKITPLDGMSINPQGPWELELETTTHEKISRKDFDANLPGFQLQLKTSEEVSFKLIAFICTKDKKQCFRDVHTGKAQAK